MSRKLKQRLAQDFYASFCALKERKEYDAQSLCRHSKMRVCFVWLGLLIFLTPCGTKNWGSFSLGGTQQIVSDPEPSKQSSPKKISQLLSRFLVQLANVGGGLCAVAAAIGLMGKWHWFAELFTNFPLQYAGGLLVSGCGLVVLGKKTTGKMFLALGCLNLYFVLPIYLPTANGVSKASGPATRILLSNVLTTNPNKDLALKTYQTSDADILVLLEFDHEWQKACREKLSRDYPFQLERPQNDNFGMACYSKLSPKTFEVIGLGRYSLMAMLLEFEIEGAPLTLIAAHPLPPVREANARDRNLYLSEIAELAAGKPNVVLVGDLNLTPYSPYFKDLIRSGQLQDSRQGFGIGASFPTDSWLLRIPIDHVLVGEKVSVADRKILRSIGSDHFPIQIDVFIDD